MKRTQLTGVLTIVFLWVGLNAFAEPNAIKIIDLNNKKECVLIKNQGKTPVDLKGWQLHDHDSGKKTKKHTYTFKTLQLKPGEVIQVQSGIAKKTLQAEPQAARLKQADHYIFWTSSRVWNDSFDIAYLRDSKGNLIDEKKNGKSPAPKGKK